MSTTLEATQYEVGKQYSPHRASWPECAQYNYRSGGHELVLFFASPADEEIAAVRRGNAEFGLYVSGPLLVFLYHFGDELPWSDAPYSWHLVPASERDLPSADLEEKGRAVLHVMLVDARTGILRAQRATTLSPQFTRALHSAIRAQSNLPWNSVQYDGLLEQLYARHDSSQLARLASVRSKGRAQ